MGHPDWARSGWNFHFFTKFEKFTIFWNWRFFGQKKWILKYLFNGILEACFKTPQKFFLDLVPGGYSDLASARDRPPFSKPLSVVATTGTNCASFICVTWCNGFSLCLVFFAENQRTERCAFGELQIQHRHWYLIIWCVFCKQPTCGMGRLCAHKHRLLHRVHRSFRLSSTTFAKSLSWWSQPKWARAGPDGRSDHLYLQFHRNLRQLHPFVTTRRCMHWPYIGRPRLTTSCPTGLASQSTWIHVRDSWAHSSTWFDFRGSVPSTCVGKCADACAYSHRCATVPNLLLGWYDWGRVATRWVSKWYLLGACLQSFCFKLHMSSNFCVVHQGLGVPVIQLVHRHHEVQQHHRCPHIFFTFLDHAGRGGSSCQHRTCKGR